MKVHNKKQNIQKYRLITSCSIYADVSQELQMAFHFIFGTHHALTSTVQKPDVSQSSGFMVIFGVVSSLNTFKPSVESVRRCNKNVQCTISSYDILLNETIC